MVTIGATKITKKKMSIVVIEVIIITYNISLIYIYIILKQKNQSNYHTNYLFQVEGEEGVVVTEVIVVAEVVEVIEETVEEGIMTAGEVDMIEVAEVDLTDLIAEEEITNAVAAA